MSQPEPSLRPARLLALCVIAVMLLLQPLAYATPASAGTVPPPAVTATLGDPHELETFIHGVMNKLVWEQHIAGAQVVVVKDGQILLAKGYGYANVENGILVEGEKTLFRPGSVTKLFTWTAVMQLVEQGKIDLLADVNTYLTDFQIPATYAGGGSDSTSITMLDLMSHTAGFEEISWKAGSMDAEDVEKSTSLGDLVMGFMPARVFPVGQVPSYSNYSAMLAGHIVELVSGEDYDPYIEQHILKPLGMDHSTLLQELPADLAGDLSFSYQFYNGAYRPIPFEWMYIRPAGGLIASGADMGKFMLAHLQDGEYNGVRILKPETARLMHTQSYAFDPALTGSAHGFQESTTNGRRLIGHGGAFNGWMTALQLIPEENTGIYVSFNTAVGSELLDQVVQKFMDRYFPASAGVGDDIGEAGDSVAVDSIADGDRLSRYTGVYVSSRHNFSTPEKLQALSEMTWVGSGPEGMLSFPHLLNPFVTDNWAYVRPLVFQNTRSGELAVFHEDEHGRVRYLAVENEPFRVLIKQPWYGYIGLLLFGLLTFLLTPIAALVGFFVLLINRRSGERAPWQARLARVVALALCLVFIAFSVITYINWVDKDIPVVRILAWVVAALVLCVTVLVVTAWWKKWWGLASRLHYTIIALAGLAVTWFLVYWSVLMLP